MHAHIEHDTEARVAAHHPVVSGLRLLQRKNFVHRGDAVEVTERTRVFGVGGRARYQPRTDALFSIRLIVSTVTGPTAPIIIMVPLGPRPPAMACMACALVTVARIALAPPIACSALAGSAAALSI
jgi:hypothetical protein